MSRDDRRPLLACAGDRREEPAVERHERVDAERERVRRAIRIVGVIRELKSGDQDEVVEGAGSLGLAFDFRPVAFEVPGMNVAWRGPCLRRQHMIRHAEDVKAVTPIKIDERGEGKRSVAPGRVGVQLAEQRTGVAHDLIFDLRSRTRATGQ